MHADARAQGGERGVLNAQFVLSPGQGLPGNAPQFPPGHHAVGRARETCSRQRKQAARHDTVTHADPQLTGMPALHLGPGPVATESPQIQAHQPRFRQLGRWQSGQVRRTSPPVVARQVRQRPLAPLDATAVCANKLSQRVGVALDQDEIQHATPFGPVGRVLTLVTTTKAVQVQHPCRGNVARVGPHRFQRGSFEHRHIRRSPHHSDFFDVGRRLKWTVPHDVDVDAVDQWEEPTGGQGVHRLVQDRLVGPDRGHMNKNADGSISVACSRIGSRGAQFSASPVALKTSASVVWPFATWAMPLPSKPVSPSFITARASSDSLARCVINWAMSRSTSTRS